jgi:hypothetical protein
LQHVADQIRRCNVTFDKLKVGSFGNFIQVSQT